MVYESLKKTDQQSLIFSFMKPISFQIYRQKSYQLTYTYRYRPLRDLPKKVLEHIL